MSNVVPGLAQTLTSSSLGTLEQLPLRWRGLLGTMTVINPVTLDTSLPALTGLIVETDLEQTTTNERKQRVVSVGSPMGKSMTEYVLSPSGQNAPRVLTLVATGTAPTSPTATTVDVEQQAYGDGYSQQAVTTDPTFFPKYGIEVSRPDPIPKKFRELLPIVSTDVLVPGTSVTTPTLAAGDLSAGSQQVNVNVLRNTLATTDLSVLPKSLTSYITTPERQIGTVVETLEAVGTNMAVPSALQEVTVDTLGDGNELATVASVPSLFTAAMYRTAIPDITPEDFRALLPLSTTAMRSAGTAAMPSLSAGDYEASSRQLNVFVKESSVTSRSVDSLPASLTSYITTGEKQVGTVVRTLETAGTNTAAPDALTTVQVRNLGNGEEVVDVTSVPALFTAASYGVSTPDVVPQEFRVSSPNTTTSALIAGTASAPTLGGDLSVEKRQRDAFTYLSQITTPGSISLPAVLAGSVESNQFRQQTAVSQTLETQGAFGSSNSATAKYDVRNLGNGLEVVTLKDDGTLFSRPSYEASQPESIPERFRALIPLVGSSSVAAGTATAPTLGTYDIQAQQEQLDVFTYKQSAATRDFSSIVGVALSGQEYDDSLQIVKSFTETVVAAGSTLANANTAVQPLGNGYDVSRVEASPTVETTALVAGLYRQYPGYANIGFPPVLNGVTATYTKSAGSTTSAGAGSDTSSGRNWSIQLSMPSTGESSASVTPQIIPDITYYKAEKRLVTDYFFFLAGPAVAISDVITALGVIDVTLSSVAKWPSIEPQEVIVLVEAQRASMSARAEASVHASHWINDVDEGTSTGGVGSGSLSTDFSDNVRVETIPPTIHSAITIASTSDTQNVIASASVVITGTAAANGYANSDGTPVTATGKVTVQKGGATTPEILPTGKYIFDLNIENYKWNKLAVRARVFDFADLT